MSSNYMHSPAECENFALMRKPKFSHSNYIKIVLARVIFSASNSSPYISGDLFSSLVDYAPWNSRRKNLITALKTLFLRSHNEYVPQINVKRLKKAKTIFVPSHALATFVDTYGDSITARTIVCGNSDFNFTTVPALPPKVKKCLLQNSSISDNNKIFTLPIGLENLRLGRSGFTRFHKNENKHSIFNKILIPPMSPTNKERFNLLIWGLENSEIADVHTTLLPQDKYFKLAKKYKFIFCSEGNGSDSHRVWETLYQGSFPVMLKTSWSTSLSQMEFPIVYVESYSEITIELLKNFQKAHASYDPKKCEWLWVNAWREFINN